ncbi:MAG: glycosyltransferase family 4 protein [Gemmatimonadota bacterium]|nr:MAG: glycosyltransferase family 4 protein [Gemmatimonadota bacterium]
MRVAVSTLSITASKGGIKTYLLGLLRGLRSIDSRNEYTLLCTDENAGLFEPIADRTSNFKLEVQLSRLSSAPVRILYEETFLVSKLRSLKVDCLLIPSNVALLRETSVPQVVVLQAPLALRSLQSRSSLTGLRNRLRTLYFNTTVPLSVKRARWTVAVSEYVAALLREQCPAARDRIVAVPEGVDFEEFHRATSLARREGPGYVLFVSTLFPYKGADALLRAYACLRAGRSINPDIRLRIAGRDPDSRQIPALKALAAELGVGSLVDFLGPVPHQQIAALYAGARVFVFPSSLETFGLPPLEAMSCGVPVVASTQASVPEIVGDAGLLADPRQPAELASAIERACVDEGLRRQLIERGFQRAKRFSWEATASRFVDLFGRLEKPELMPAGGEPL